MAQRTFSVYLHVPFCRVRCGYCDFNTYTLPELGAEHPMADFRHAALAELHLAARILAPASPPPVHTVFFGGGTPTMLPASALGELLATVKSHWGLAPDAEVTTEANPDTITPEVAQALAAQGFTRVSLGMQSAVAHVLHTLDRTHAPESVPAAVEAIRAAGMQVSLDLIYGTPGETRADWQASLEAAIELNPDHVSAYALVVEEGTRLASQVRRGEVPAPDDDDEADKYERADDLLTHAGYHWYEISNWSGTSAGQCRHNLAYWRAGNWWGVGPGAHSHLGGVRWWNVKHPRAYGQRLDAGESPGHAREVLTSGQQYDETVLLGSRLAEGLPVIQLHPGGRRALAGLIADQLIEPLPGDGAGPAGSVVLTRRGRLLADTVVHRLLS